MTREKYFAHGPGVTVFYRMEQMDAPGERESQPFVVVEFIESFPRICNSRQEWDAYVETYNEQLQPEAPLKTWEDYARLLEKDKP